MTRQPRTFIALTLSLLLVIFTICQSHAMAGVSSSDASTSSSTPCADPAGKDMAAADCHQVCKQVADIAKKPQLPDMPPMLLASNGYVPLASTSVQAISRHLSDRPLGDPHPLLRFQRFLE